MIKINLLPQEYRVVVKKKKVASAAAASTAPWARLPWKWIAIGVAAIVLVITVYYNIDYWSLSKKLKTVNLESTAVQPQLQALRALEQEVNGTLVPERDFLRAYVLNKAPVTNVLQLISEILPDGTWLESLKIQNAGKQRSFRIQGVAVNIEAKTNIEQIEEYLQGLKQIIPGAKFSYSTTKQVVDQMTATAFLADYQWQAD